MSLALAGLAALLASQDTVVTPPGVEYRIEAVVDEGPDVLRARARLRYTNRSGSPLDTLWFHQHLNAFRPNSAWARREVQTGSGRFQTLGERDHAFERFTRIEADGRAIRPVYPGAPDSTVVALPLGRTLGSGETVTLVMDWVARASTLPRRQGRRGREFNWAHWYPRIAVFEKGIWQTQPLLPQGEFYGEFASYDVTLDVAADQVVGSTGVPVEGDPGWVAPGPGTQVRLAADVYATRRAEPLGLLDPAAAVGRKRLRWRAEKVHHFAWAMAPDYRYETAEWRGIPIHVLYRPNLAPDWGAGVVSARAVTALHWLDSLFGPYPYPQLTILPRIESGGGTEYPMLIMNSSASQGLIVHEATHQYAHAILANNEWRDGWLDEGLTEFVTSWFWEARGEPRHFQTDLDTLRVWERERRTQPISLPGAEFRDYRTYGRMTYTRASLVFRMLRDLIGAETMRAVLREYHRRHAFQHVDEADLRAVSEQVSGQELDWFFDQWLHTTKTLDYGISRATVERTRDRRWRTRIEVLRLGEAWMPVTLRVGTETRALTSRDRVQSVEVETAARPGEAVLDPGNVLIDLDPSNNRRGL